MLCPPRVRGVRAPPSAQVLLQRGPIRGRPALELKCCLERPGWIGRVFAACLAGSGNTVVFLISLTRSLVYLRSGANSVGFSPVLVSSTRGRSNTGYMKVPRLGVKLELQLPATATSSWGLSRVCDLHHSSWPHWIPKPLSEPRDRTLIFMDPSQVHYC